MKDDRIWAKFDVDMPDHPKIAPLTDAAYRCLSEAILWSTKHRTDGFLARRLAVARWSLETLHELCENDTRNPSLTESEDGWHIRDFDKHQTTRAEIEARRERNRIAGQLGGLAKVKRPAKRNAKQPAKRNASKSISETVSENVADKEENPYGFSTADRGAAPNGAPRSALDAAVEAAAASREKRRQDIDDCGLCDDDGYRSNFTVCDHIDRSAITAAGSAACREAIAETKARKANRQ